MHIFSPSLHAVCLSRCCHTHPPCSSQAYAITHIFSEKLEIAFREAEALKRQDLLIAEEEEGQRLEDERAAQVGGAQLHCVVSFVLPLFSNRFAGTHFLGCDVFGVATSCVFWEDIAFFALKATNSPLLWVQALSRQLVSQPPQRAAADKEKKAKKKERQKVKREADLARKEAEEAQRRQEAEKHRQEAEKKRCGAKPHARTSASRACNLMQRALSYLKHLLNIIATGPE